MAATLRPRRRLGISQMGEPQLINLDEEALR
jgi:hypothetical protein